MFRIGSSINQSIAGAEAAERAAAKDAVKRKGPQGPARTTKDEVTLTGLNATGPEAARALKGNADEETKQDRREHPAYQKDGKGKSKRPPSLDLKG